MRQLPGAQRQLLGSERRLCSQRTSGSKSRSSMSFSEKALATPSCIVSRRVSDPSSRSSTELTTVSWGVDTCRQLRA